MADYKKLVEALRCCAGANTKPTKCPDYDDSWCDGKCLDKHLITAADAIEALQAELDQWKAAVKGQEDGIKVLQAEVERLQVDVEAAYALMEVQE